MPSESENKEFSVPTVAGDSQLWGPELNFGWIQPEDSLLGGSLTIQASLGSQVLTSSQAYTLLYNITGSLSGDILITFPSESAGGGIYIFSNQILSSNSGGFFVFAGTNSSLSVPISIPFNGESTVTGNGTSLQFSDNALHNTGTLEFSVIGNGGGITGSLLGYQPIPFNGIINRVTVVANGTSTQAIDLQVCTVSDFDGGVTHPSTSDSITGGNPPVLHGASTYQSTSLTNWTTTLTAGNIIAITSTTGSTTITNFTLSLQMTRI